ncbi:MAG TPA: hypothetical protein VIR16_03575 [Candidatus Limnocylindrales bacterium]
MHRFKSLADIVGRLVHIIVPAPAEPERAPTEDDIRSERFFRANRTV